MTRFDLSPFYRSTIGFDHLASLIDNIDRAAGQNTSPSYPPYNIEKLDEHSYRIAMAVAGFSEDEIDIATQDNALVVSGGKEQISDSESAQYLHRGIAARSFEQRFKLADYVEVKSAHLENGMLHVDLVKEIPEKMKAKKIAVKSGSMLEKVKKLTKSDKKAA